MEKVRIKNTKGGNISAVIHSPKILTEKLAILCPGYLDTKDYDHLVMLAEALAGQGNTVVRFDPTGTWESDGSVSDYLTSQYLKDIKSVLEYMLGKHNFTDILLGGHSRGGMVSILHASRDSRVTQVVGIMPSSRASGKNRDDWKEQGYRLSKRDIPGQMGTKKFKVPYAHMLDRDQFDVFSDVKNIHASVLLITGEFDKAVLPEEVRKIFDNANEPKKYILIKNIDHEYRHNKEVIKIVNDTIIKELV